jgi:hypothetical protein
MTVSQRPPHSVAMAAATPALSRPHASRCAKPAPRSGFSLDSAVFAVAATSVRLPNEAGVNLYNVHRCVIVARRNQRGL